MHCALARILVSSPQQYAMLHVTSMFLERIVMGHSFSTVPLKSPWCAFHFVQRYEHLHLAHVRIEHKGHYPLRFGWKKSAQFQCARNCTSCWMSRLPSWKSKTTEILIFVIPVVAKQPKSISRIPAALHYWCWSRFSDKKGNSLMRSTWSRLPFTNERNTWSTIETHWRIATSNAWPLSSHVTETQKTRVWTLKPTSLCHPAPNLFITPICCRAHQRRGISTSNIDSTLGLLASWRSRTADDPERCKMRDGCQVLQRLALHPHRRSFIELAFFIGLDIVKVGNFVLRHWRRRRNLTAPFPNSRPSAWRFLACAKTAHDSCSPARMSLHAGLSWFCWRYDHSQPLPTHLPMVWSAHVCTKLKWVSFMKVATYFAELARAAAFHGRMMQRPRGWHTEVMPASTYARRTWLNSSRMRDRKCPTERSRP